jgi:hypothetical protein
MMVEIDCVSHTRIWLHQHRCCPACAQEILSVILSAYHMHACNLAQVVHGDLDDL